MVAAVSADAAEKQPEHQSAINAKSVKEKRAIILHHTSPYVYHSPVITTVHHSAPLIHAAPIVHHAAPIVATHAVHTVHPVYSSHVMFISENFR